MQKKSSSALMLLRKLYELFSSMRFAVSLLILISIASIAGTIIQQNMEPIEYTRRYGIFWVEFFQYVELHNIYSAKWFLFVLLFLVISTSLCLIKNTPKMLKEVRAYREDIRVKALASFPHYVEGEVHGVGLQKGQDNIQQLLKQSGYKVRNKSLENGVMIAGKKGMWNRLGYIFAHAAIVFICLGGLLNGELMTSWQIWWSNKVGVTSNLTIAEVPEQARLPLSTPSFRANLRITEGRTRSEAVVSHNNSYYLQPLPFSITLKDFLVEYYETGMPSNFMSVVEVFDPDTKQTTEHKISVNHPLSVKGFTIYQSGLDDDSSILQLKGYPLNGGAAFNIKPLQVGDPTEIRSESSDLAVELPKVELEIRNFKLRNIENFNSPEQENRPIEEQVLGVLANNNLEKKLKSFGPSIEYGLRYPTGVLVNYKVYMQPIEDEKTGVYHYLFGAQTPSDTDYRYLFIPADQSQSLQTFFRLREQLYNDEAVQLAVKRMVQRQYADASKLQQQGFEVFALQSAHYFADQGTAGQVVSAYSVFLQMTGEELPSENYDFAEVMRRLQGDLMNGRAEKLKSFLSLFALTKELTKGVVTELYLMEQENQAPQNLELQAQWLESMYRALGDVHQYPAPFLVTLEDFEHIESSIFQVSRSSGSFVLYAGCVLLILGVFMMLYVPQRRLWVHLYQKDSDTLAWSMAFTSVRRGFQFEEEFKRHSTQLQSVISS